MLYINWPEWLQPESFEIGLRSNVAITSNTYTGQITTQELPGSRFVVRATMPPSLGSHQAEVEAFFAKVRGQANRIMLWHLKRPVPRGTLRGDPVTADSALQGETMVLIAGGGSGATLLPGDMISIQTVHNAQLVQVVEASGSGTIQAEISPPLQANVNAGAPVYWYRPHAAFISMNQEIMIPYGKSGIDPGVSIDLVQVA